MHESRRASCSGLLAALASKLHVRRHSLHHTSPPAADIRVVHEDARQRRHRAFEAAEQARGAPDGARQRAFDAFLHGAERRAADEDARRAARVRTALEEHRAACALVAARRGRVFEADEERRPRTFEPAPAQYAAHAETAARYRKRAVRHAERRIASDAGRLERAIAVLSSGVRHRLQSSFAARKRTDVAGPKEEVHPTVAAHLAQTKRSAATSGNAVAPAKKVKFKSAVDIIPSRRPAERTATGTTHPVVSGAPHPKRAAASYTLSDSSSATLTDPPHRHARAPPSPNARAPPSPAGTFPRRPDARRAAAPPYPVSRAPDAPRTQHALLFAQDEAARRADFCAGERLRATREAARQRVFEREQDARTVRRAAQAAARAADVHTSGEAVLDAERERARHARGAARARGERVRDLADRDARRAAWDRWAHADAVAQRAERVWRASERAWERIDELRRANGNGEAQHFPWPAPPKPELCAFTDYAPALEGPEVHWWTEESRIPTSTAGEAPAYFYGSGELSSGRSTPPLEKQDDRQDIETPPPVIHAPCPLAMEDAAHCKLSAIGSDGDQDAYVDDDDAGWASVPEQKLFAHMEQQRERQFEEGQSARAEQFVAAEQERQVAFLRAQEARQAALQAPEEEDCRAFEAELSALSIAHIDLEARLRASAQELDEHLEAEAARDAESFRSAEARTFDSFHSGLKRVYESFRRWAEETEVYWQTFDASVRAAVEAEACTA